MVLQVKEKVKVGPRSSTPTLFMKYIRHKYINKVIATS